MTERDTALYEAFKAKDARFDGRFFVGISSTGVYCRPICWKKPVIALAFYAGRSLRREIPLWTHPRSWPEKRHGFWMKTAGAARAWRSWRKHWAAQGGTCAVCL